MPFCARTSPKLNRVERPVILRSSSGIHNDGTVDGSRHIKAAWTWHSDAKYLIASLALLFALLSTVCAPLAPLFDPDEGYYPATAAETLRSGPFWDLRFNGAPRWEKPVLSYAFIEVAFRAGGENVTAARIPSAVEGATLIAIIGLLVVRLAGGRAGALSALVAGTTLGISIFSRVAHPEIALVLSVVTAELLICVWLSATDVRGQLLSALGIGIAVALGLLAKGPVAVVLPVLTFISALPFCSPSRHTVGSLAGSLAVSASVALMLTLPWYLAMWIRHGAAFMLESVWEQNVERYTSAAYGHKTGVISLLLPALLGLLPWAACLPQALVRVRPRERTSRDILRTVMCASAITALAFYSLSSSKLASYSLVCVPPLAIVIGLWLDEEFESQPTTDRPWIQTSAVLGILAAALLSGRWWIGHLVTPRQLFGAFHPAASDVGTVLGPVTLALGCLTAATAIALAFTRKLGGRVAVVACLGAVAPVAGLIAAHSLLDSMYPWADLGRRIVPGHGHVWLLGRRAPSLTFYARQPVSTVRDPTMLAAEMLHEPEGWLALTREDWTLLSATDGVRKTQTVVVAEHGRMMLVRFVNPRAEHAAIH